MSRSRRFLAFAGVLVVAVAGYVLVVLAPVETRSPAEPPNRPDRSDRSDQPNILLFTTDDQRFDELAAMPRTRRLLAARGVSFANSVSPDPLCCPARASILTGQYTHNHGVRGNAWPHGGYYRLRGDNTLPVWLGEAGYTTAFVGKYLNEYGGRDPHEVPPGWDVWKAPVRGVYDYDDVVLNENGRLVRYRNRYQSELYAALSERIIRSAAGEDRPFFLWQSQLAPHTRHEIAWSDGGERARKRKDGGWRPPKPPARLTGKYDGRRVPRSPAFNERSVRDKPAHLSRRPRLDDRQMADLDRQRQRRLESLRAADAAVARTIGTLADVGELDNTLIIFTSDNGFLLGEHRYTGKKLPYEPSVRVPLLMRGPGVPAGVVRRQPAATIDIAPTVTDAANARRGLRVDGRSLLPLAADPGAGRKRPILLESGPRGDGKASFYRGVRTNRWTYVAYRNGDVELYDRRRDPHQLRSLHKEPALASVRKRLRHLVDRLGDCAGTACRTGSAPGR